MAHLSIVGCLQDLKKFVREEIANDILLQRENSDPPEYVHPYVGLVTSPHKNFMPVNFQVPYIHIGLAQGTMDVSKENAVTVRFQCAVYGGDYQFQQDANLPDETGYIDLLNLIERIMHKLTQAAVIGNCVIDTNFEYGVYNEQITYPYHYGYVQFSIQLPTINRQPTEEIKELLDF